MLPFHTDIMGVGLKRKEGPGGASAPKSTRPTTEPRPSKRAKPSESTKPAKPTKDDGKKGAKEPKSSDSKPSPFVSQLKEEEPLFPRGGGSVLTPLEQKQISIQAKKDVLFEETKSGNKGDKAVKKQKKRKSREDDASAKVVDEDAVKVESLNFKVGQPWD